MYGVGGVILEWFKIKIEKVERKNPKRMCRK